MKHHISTPRPNWRDIVENQGLTYAIHDSTGEPYWNESEYFEFDESEIEYLERVTEELHEMAVAASREMAKSPEFLGLLDIPFQAEEYVEKSLDNPNQISLYGRFDLAWDGTGDAKLLEYNADTPAALVEASVTQWHWLEDVFGPNDKDQWNMIHERLLQAWKQHAPSIPNGVVHFAAGQNEPTEDWATVAYLRDTASEAGLTDLGITMEEIGWHHELKQFVDAAEVPIHVIFKMYPWEWMLNEEFSRYVISSESTTRWIEPAWKLLAGSKALLAMMWKLYPEHPNLLPAFVNKPDSMQEYVAKPVFGWEGAGIRVVSKVGQFENAAAHTQGQREIYQQYTPLPKFNNKHVVLGTWVINGHAAGLGIRQSTSPITDTGAQFVPHVINTTRSTGVQIEAWLNER